MMSDHVPLRPLGAGLGPLRKAWLDADAADYWPGDQLGEAMDFGQALAALKAGARVTRNGWNGSGMWIELQRPDEHSKMRREYLFMSPIDGALVPWVASQTDLLANDWQVAA